MLENAEISVNNWKLYHIIHHEFKKKHKNLQTETKVATPSAK